FLGEDEQARLPDAGEGAIAVGVAGEDDADVVEQRARVGAGGEAGAGADVERAFRDALEQGGDRLEERGDVRGLDAGHEGGGAAGSHPASVPRRVRRTPWPAR